MSGFHPGMEKDRISMSQRERDVLKVMSLVLAGRRTQAEAGRLLGRSVRQVRRLQRRLEAEGDTGVVHRLRGRASNAAWEDGLRERVLALYREHYPDFGPTFFGEKLVEAHEVSVSRQTLHVWLTE